jgi:hypothetical protein
MEIYVFFLHSHRRIINLIFYSTFLKCYYLYPAFLVFEIQRNILLIFFCSFLSIHSFQLMMFFYSKYARLYMPSHFYRNISTATAAQGIMQLLKVFIKGGSGCLKYNIYSVLSFHLFFFFLLINGRI